MDGRRTPAAASRQGRRDRPRAPPAQRRVRGDPRRPEEERLLRALPPVRREERLRAIRHPSVLRVRLRHAAGLRLPVEEVAEALRVAGRHAGGLQVLQVVVVRQVVDALLHQLLGLEAEPLAMEVELAHAVGAVARVRERGHYRRPGGHRARRAVGLGHEAVGRDAGLRGTPPGEQRVPRRHADRRGRHRLAVPRALRGEPVEVRRSHPRVAGEAEVVVAELVRHEQEYVGRGLRHRSWTACARDKGSHSVIRKESGGGNEPIGAFGILSGSRVRFLPCRFPPPRQPPHPPGASRAPARRPLFASAFRPRPPLTRRVHPHRAARGDLHHRPARRHPAAGALRRPRGGSQRAVPVEPAAGGHCRQRLTTPTSAAIPPTCRS